MQQALGRVRMAEVQISEASSLEELDLGRTALQQAYAEVQHVVRAAKRDLGIPLRTIDECTSMHQRLIHHLFKGTAEGARQRSMRGEAS